MTAPSTGQSIWYLTQSALNMLLSFELENKILCLLNIPWYDVISHIFYDEKTTDEQNLVRLLITHYGQMSHLYPGELSHYWFGSDKILSPEWRLAFI